MPRARFLVGLALLAVVASRAHAQGLQICEAVTADAPGDTDGMRRTSIVTLPGSEAWVGRPLLDLAPGSVETVGLEVGPDGATLSLWLSEAAGAAFEALTARSVGHALAVVYQGRVLTVPVVESAIPNGLVLITGLEAEEGRRLADALRGVSAVPVEPSPPVTDRTDAGPLLPERPPRGPEFPDRSASPSPDAPEAVAEAWASAVGGRDWMAAAGLLHPDAVAALRPDALALLRLDGPLVRVRDGQTEGSFPAIRALGHPPAAARVDALPVEDLAALYLAALDVLGRWGAPGPARRAVGVLPDGDRAHVVLRAESAARGLADVSAVSLARDAFGRWRVLLTQARGF